MARRTRAAKAAETIDWGHLPDLVGFQLRQAQGRVFDDFLAAMADDAVTPGQYGLLVLIAANAGPSQSALARALNVERSTMVAAIDKLERRGLVRRRASAADQRANELVLTGAGTALVARLAAKVADHESRICAGLSDDERTELVRLLKKIGT